MLNSVPTSSAAGLDGMKGNMYKLVPCDVGVKSSVYGKVLELIVGKIIKEHKFPH